MSATDRRIGRSIGAVLAGIITGAVLSLLTDMALRALGIMPRLGVGVTDSLLLLVTTYRIVYGVLGSYITARLAPNRPMQHALILGLLGTAVCILGAIMTWNNVAAYGAHWYPIVLIVTAIPCAWAGAELAERKLHASHAI